LEFSTLIISEVADVHSRFFLEQDPSLSYPYVVVLQGEEVTDTNLILGSVLTPLFGIAVCQITLALYEKYMDREIKKKYTSVFLKYYFKPYIFAAQSIVIALFITEIFKKFSGRLRPNFYAYCNYQGYRNATLSGDYSSYYNATQFGRIGNFSNCLDQDAVPDAHESFPSGHSSTIFSGLAPFAYYLWTIFVREAEHFESLHGMRKLRIKSLFAGFGLAAFCCAAYVAATRPRDYFHNYDDILAGCCIGVFSSGLAFVTHNDKYVRVQDGENGQKHDINIQENETKTEDKKVEDKSNHRESDDKNKDKSDD